MTESKPLTTAKLVLTGFDLFKSFSLAFAVVLIEWLRIKQKKAEDRQAIAEMELSVERQQNSNKPSDPDAVLDKFLNRDG